MTFYRLQRPAVKRLHAGAAALLLCLYAAAAWHGIGEHHLVDYGPATSGPAICGASPDSHSHAHGGPGDATEPVGSDAHDCALCTLLHAPATPGVTLAAPVINGTAIAVFPAPVVVVARTLVGTMPSRAPPSSHA